MASAGDSEPDFATMPIEAVVEMALDCIGLDINAPPGSGADIWLIKRPPEILLPLTAALMQDVRPERRILSAHLLGQANWTWPAIRADATSRLRAMLDADTDPDVLSQAAIGVGFWADERALPALIRLKSNKNSSVRYGVVHGLSGIELESAKRHLIDLTRDDDENVRDWAVFGLGQLTQLDFPEQRDALVAALADPVSMVRAEAIDGLSVRGDRRAVGALKRELAAVPDDEEWPFLWECAERLHVRELLPELQSHADRCVRAQRPVPTALVAALESCRAMDRE